MRIETFRGAPFVDREEEIEFFVDWFNRVPQRILWVYGPKSSGKTTVIEYVIEKYLLPEGERFWIKYFNLRRALISSYESFLDSFFTGIEESEKGIKGRIDLFGFKMEVWKRIKERRVNLFIAFMDELKEVRKWYERCVIVVDEIQKLRDVYIRNSNGERELLKEFLNFCVSLTKETHLSHVVILTSNTVFIERIYNDARMKETSRFKKIKHLDYKKVVNWLDMEGLNREEIELIWEYLGGNINRILLTLEEIRKGIDLKDYLKREAWLAYTEIDEYLAEFDEKETNFFIDVAKSIVDRGYYDISGVKADKRRILQAWAEREILFYDPLELRVTGNSRIYEKGMEILLKRHQNNQNFKKI